MNGYIKKEQQNQNRYINRPYYRHWYIKQAVGHQYNLTIKV